MQVFSLVDGAFAGVAPRPAHVSSGPPPDGRAKLFDTQILRYADAARHADAFAVSADVRGDAADDSVALADAAHLTLITYQRPVSGSLESNSTEANVAGDVTALSTLGASVAASIAQLQAMVAAGSPNLAPAIASLTATHTAHDGTRARHEPRGHPPAADAAAGRPERPGRRTAGNLVTATAEPSKVPPYATTLLSDT